MRIAVPIWEGRVSPVFDVARELLLVDVEQLAPAHREIQPLHAESDRHRVEALSNLGVELLICGAISRSLQAMLAGAGIRVIPHICGGSDDVIVAFLTNRLCRDAAYQLPGCRHSAPRQARRRRRLRRGCDPGAEPAPRDSA